MSSTKTNLFIFMLMASINYCFFFESHGACDCPRKQDDPLVIDITKARPKVFSKPSEKTNPFDFFSYETPGNPGTWLPFWRGPLPHWAGRA